LSVVAVPQFSIVTPSLRQFDWLQLCAASIADQAGVTVEHCVQDAGTGVELESWAATHPGLSLVVERDDGMYDAINRGLRRARGELLAYLNCDEQYLTGALARVWRFFLEHPETEVLFGDAILVDGEGQPLSYRRTVRPTRWHTRAVHLNTLTCATFFRRSLLERGLFFDSQWKVIGDAVWVDTVLSAGVKVAVLGEPLAAFAFTGANLGATVRSTEEARRWRAASGYGRLPGIASFLHRLHKCLAGAYRHRTLDYAIYTRRSPGQRVLFHAPRLGYGWPGA
jgi:glycosyltransferase involved in cell wall biosynthesis